MIRKALLICGILSSLLYAVMNIFIAMQWESYSSAAQTVSELSAIGAPTRPVWVAWSVVYTLLFIAFGWSVRMSAYQNRHLHITGTTIFLYGIISVAWPFAPMHLRGEAFALTDAMHIALGIVTIILMLIIFGFGASAFGKMFRRYTIGSILVFLVFGTLTGLASPRIAENLPTPWIGVWERINIGVFLLWVVVLAIILLRRNVPSAEAMIFHHGGTETRR